MLVSSLDVRRHEVPEARRRVVTNQAVLVRSREQGLHRRKLEPAGVACDVASHDVLRVLPELRWADLGEQHPTEELDRTVPGEPTVRLDPEGAAIRP